MKFSDKLRTERKKLGLSQTALAEKTGISLRTLQNYELGKRYPASIDITMRLAAALGTTTQSLLSAGEESIVSAPSASAKAQLEELVKGVSGLFAGGQIGEEDRDAAMEAIIAAYWAAKKEGRGTKKENGEEN